jgi:hypothetical protein
MKMYFVNTICTKQLPKPQKRVAVKLKSLGEQILNKRNQIKMLISGQEHTLT